MGFFIWFSLGLIGIVIAFTFQWFTENKISLTLAELFFAIGLFLIGPVGLILSFMFIMFELYDRGTFSKDVINITRKKDES